MNPNDLISLIGKDYQDTAVQGFLNAVDITRVPKLKRGDPTAIVENKKQGIEITFRDGGQLDVKSEQHKAGDLVLANIRCYGPGHASFRQFAGQLPLGLQFEFGADEAQVALGRKPAWSDRGLGKSRWDLDGLSVFVTFEKKNKGIRNVSFQLPLA